MKYIFLTYDGIGLPVAYKLLLEGNDVIVGQAKKLEHMPKEEEELSKRRLSLYDGMIEKMDADELIEKMKKENPEDWFVICDFNYVYPYSEKLKKMGFRGLLPTREDFEFEEDRNKAKEYVFRKYEIFSQQDIQEFDSTKEALEFLKESEKIYGIKGFNPDAPTYFPMSNDKQVAYEELEDIMMENQKHYESEGFILEEKIEDMIECIPELIAFDGEIVGINVNLENKPIGAGNIGFQTGDAASFIFWVGKDEPAFQKLYDLFFKPSIDKWVRENEMMVWDAGVMYSPSRDAFYFMEFCSAREGYSALFDKLSTFNSVSEYYERIMNKQYLFDKDVKPFGNSIRIFNEIRDNHFKHLYMKDARIITDEKNYNVWVRDAHNKNGKLYTTGYDHDLAVITYAGNNWKENFYIIDNMLSDGKTFVFPGMIYRKAFDLVRDDYPQNFEKRIRFVYNFLGREMPKEWQREEATIKEQAFVRKEQEEENRQTKQLLDNLLKQIDEL
jgi:hypothetical protein